MRSWTARANTRSFTSWRDFERRLAAKQDKRVPLFAYLDGTLELMSPSFDHDAITRRIEHLLVAYALKHGIDLDTAGSWTLKNKLEKVGVEPDNCYLFGRSLRRRRRPDLAIEIAWSRGGVSKLEIYRRLHVPEVWFWRRGVIEIYKLRKTGYHRVEQSQFFPAIDLPHLSSFLDQETIPMIRAYTAALARASVPKHAPARRAAHRRGIRRG